MKLPSFEPVPQSPEPEDLGLAVKLAGEEFKVGVPICAYGSYLVDGQFIAKCHDEPLTWIMITVIRRDQPGIWTKAVVEKPNLAPVPKQTDEKTDPSFRRSGYFNLDLQQHLDLPSEPGSYWLLVTLGDHKTELLPFAIR